MKCASPNMIDFDSTPINTANVRKKSAFWGIGPGGWIEAHRVCKNCKELWKRGPYWANWTGSDKPNKGGVGGLSWNVCSRCETALPLIEGTYSCVKIGDCLAAATRINRS